MFHFIVVMLAVGDLQAAFQTQYLGPYANVYYNTHNISQIHLEEFLSFSHEPDST